MDGMSTGDSQPNAPEIDIESFAELHAKGVPVIDVREPDEYREARIPGVIHIPLGDLGQHLQSLPAERPLYLVCATGGRSLMAATALQNQAGVEAISIAGGTKGWIASGREVESGA
jgi:rhodanese-related sulfurtransferase